MSYYGSNYPKQWEIVYVTISHFSDDKGGIIYCKLVEYENKEGVLSTKELDKDMAKNPKKSLTENKIYPMIVTAVDENREWIELTYKRIKKKEREIYLDKFNYISKIYGLTKELSQFTNIMINDILPVTMWRVLSKDDLDDSRDKFYTIMEDLKSYVEPIMHTHPDQVNQFLQNAQSRIINTRMTIHQEFDICVICCKAVEILKNILYYDNDRDDSIKIEYVNAPKYRIIVKGTAENECDIKLQKVLDLLKCRINENDTSGNGIKFNLGDKKTIREKEIIVKRLPVQYFTFIQRK